MLKWVKSKHLFLFGLILLTALVIALYNTQLKLKYPLNKAKIKHEGEVNPTKLFDLEVLYTLNNIKLCGNNASEDILAIMIVTSFFGNVEMRNLIRQAFSNAKLKRHKIRRLFLLAEAPNDNYTNQTAIVHESENFQDILQGNFLEDYRNLTYKHLMGLKWVGQFCFHAKYVIKMDDDIVVYMYRIPTLLNSFSSIFDKKFVSGYVLKNMKPSREPANKWFVTPQEYRPNLYPTFLSGWFYITNPTTLSKIVELADRVKYFWIDDVLITGVLVQMARIKRIDIHRYFTLHSEFLECCIKDLEKNITCEILIGPNGGNNLLFYEFNEKLKICHYQNCKKREKSLNETCVAEHKVNLGRGKAFISNFKLG